MLVLSLIVFCARCHSRGEHQKIGVLMLVFSTMCFTGSQITTTSLAEDRFGRDRLRGDHSELLARAVRDPNEHEQLREGTLIPPTVGQIVMLGRRWAFVPANQTQRPQEDLVDAHQSHYRSWTVGHSATLRPTRLGVASHRANRSPGNGTSLVRTDSDDIQSDVKEQLPHILIAENLMLQRIVEAIRLDGSDDQWMVSGEVTEFFNENRLMIRTAQRANAD